MNTIDPIQLGRTICSTAMQFNELREVKPNELWENPHPAHRDAKIVNLLIAQLKSVGWSPPLAYCAAFVDAVVCMALTNLGASKEQIAKFTKLQQLGVLNSARAFEEAGLLQKNLEIMYRRTPARPPNDRSMPIRVTNELYSAKVESGSIWLARHGQTELGHEGIVLTSHEGELLSTIEANTSKDAKPGDHDREGDWITTKAFPPEGRGSLRTIGFVTPSSICQLINQ